MSLSSLLIPVWVRPVLIAVTITTALSTLAWYRAELKNDGRSEARAECAAKSATAKSAQANKSAAASTALSKKVTGQEIAYKARIEEALIYVPNENTNCPIDPKFNRLYNATDAVSTPGVE